MPGRLRATSQMGAHAGRNFVRSRGNPGRRVVHPPRQTAASSDPQHDRQDAGDADRHSNGQEDHCGRERVAEIHPQFLP